MKTVLLENAIKKVQYKEKVPRNKFLPEGKYPIISQEQDLVNGFWDDDGLLMSFKNPVTIFGDHTKILKFIDFDFVLGADGVKILDPIDEIDPKYFYYALKNIELEDLGYARHFRILKQAKIAYPESIEEQKRVVKKLDEAFAAIDKAKENTEKNLKNSRELFGVGMNNLFGEIKEPGIEPLGDLCKVEIGRTPSRADFSLWGVDGGTKNIWVSIADLNHVDESSTINDSKEYVSNKAVPRMKLVKKGTLLVSFKLTLGRLAYAGRDLFTNEAIAALSLKDKSKISNEYLYYFLRFFDWDKAAEGSDKIKGKTLNKAKLQDIEVFYPKTIDEQDEIVRELDQLSKQTEDLHELFQKKLEVLEELRQSILKQALEGKL